MIGLFANIVGAFILFKTGLPLMLPEMTWGGPSALQRPASEPINSQWLFQFVIIGFKRFHLNPLSSN